MCRFGIDDFYFLVEDIEENLVDILKDKNNIEIEHTPGVVQKLVELIEGQVKMSYRAGIERGEQEAEEEKEGPC